MGVGRRRDRDRQEDARTKAAGFVFLEFERRALAIQQAQPLADVREPDAASRRRGAAARTGTGTLALPLLATRAAARRSSMRPLVQDPMKT